MEGDRAAEKLCDALGDREDELQPEALGDAAGDRDGEAEPHALRAFDTERASVNVRVGVTATVKLNEGLMVVVARAASVREKLTVSVADGHTLPLGERVRDTVDVEHDDAETHREGAGVTLGEPESDCGGVALGVAAGDREDEPQPVEL